MFKRIRPKRISDEICEQIAHLILSGKLKPGDKLPPERELAQKLGVSRPVLREAISRLIAKGYLEIIQGSGTYVRSSIADGILEESAFQDFLRKGVGILPEVVEVRKILETWAAAAAAKRATSEELDQMREYLSEFEEAAKKGRLAHVADANFHLAIAYASHNVLLMHLMDSIYNLIEKVTYEVGLKIYRDPDAYMKLFNQHRAIYDAVASKDPELAYVRMMEHMIYVERCIREAVGRDKEPIIRLSIFSS